MQLAEGYMCLAEPQVLPGCSVAASQLPSTADGAGHVASFMRLAATLMSLAHGAVHKEQRLGAVRTQLPCRRGCAAWRVDCVLVHAAVTGHGIERPLLSSAPRTCTLSTAAQVSRTHCGLLPALRKTARICCKALQTTRLHTSKGRQLEGIGFCKQ